MGIIQRDMEAKTSDKADELALEQYGREFSKLTPSLQMQVWISAEEDVTQQFVREGEAKMDAEDEKGSSHWDKLELMRRLGK